METHQHSEMCNGDEMWNVKCRRHMAMRALMAIIVIIFVFWCGFQFGEIRALAGNYGYRAMQGGWGTSAGNPTSMMNGLYQY